MHTFFLVLVLGNRRTSHLDSVEPYYYNGMSSLSVKQNLLSSFWLPFVENFLNFDSMCTQTLHVVDDPYPSVYVGVVNFIYIDILAHLRLSAYFLADFAISIIMHL